MLRSILLALLCSATLAAADTPRPSTIDETLVLLRDTLRDRGWPNARINRAEQNIEVGDGNIANPDNLHLNLRAARTDAERSVLLDEFVGALEAALAAPSDADLALGRILPIIRDRRSLEDRQQTVVSRPFLGELRVYYVIDHPDRVEYLTKEALKNAKLSGAEIWTVSLQNLRHKVEITTFDTSQGVYVVETDGYYESSLLLYADLWTSVAAQLGGPIALIMPARNLVIFGPADDPDLVAYLKSLARSLIAASPGALSDDVFFWRGGAWTTR